ncbi:pyruvate dehydrogenase (acetyl-transferring) E1 component subunit alpha [Amphritea balenae]|uniref:Pyruvate dehydrogenase E1 component subunit alpha n=1 Tax=Amphritea balenae TaxID=452629 RepID=A0A3P1SM96_9GAMM|nr:pyruvate dehydrogenase (acetyl-transferring) E1 component subunit alpha [Amphritea balenae]RRC98363.1 pyruvate dehydrogenase (acetyl-transferring) E1 component subunit alpha [Amphritea balenae]GGK81284.1 pyruvate dehydrogenase E1 component subunit alpha [Amphritea balenae]
MDTVYTAEIHYSSYLSESGTALQKMPQWAEKPEQLVHYYRNMVLARQLDNKIIALQRTGQIGTYASLLGSEAIDTVLGELMLKEDVLVPYYRNHALQMLRGLPMGEMLSYWGGDERGNSSPAMAEDFPNAVPIATQALHATGVATAFKIRSEKRVAVTVCGDGATSKGDFMEALNVAGAWQLPVIFIVNNNQWAISVPRSIQCGAATLAQKAIGAGIRGEQVDGNDVIAMHESVNEALKHAREGKGATLIEAISYRLSDHTTADDATRYRSNDELKAAWDREPVKRLQTYLHSQGWWDEVQETAWQNEVSQIIQKGVDHYLAMPPQPIENLFDYLYAELPEALQEQRDKLIRNAQPGGSHHE